MTSKDFFEEAKYEWCASEQQDKPLLNDMMKFAKLYHTEQLILSGVSNTLKAYTEWQDTTEIDLGAYTNDEQYKLYLDSF